MGYNELSNRKRRLIDIVCRYTPEAKEIFMEYLNAITSDETTVDHEEYVFRVFEANNGFPMPEEAREEYKRRIGHA